MKKIISKSEKETMKIAKEIAQSCSGGEVFALYGDLGAGKTKFVQGMAQGLAVKEKVNSPTFNIIKLYKIKRKDTKMLYHIDTYRLSADKELIELGFLEFLKDKNSIIAIEWPEKVKDILPKKTKIIEIKHKSETEREIIIK